MREACERRAGWGREERGTRRLLRGWFRLVSRRKGTDWPQGGGSDMQRV